MSEGFTITVQQPRLIGDAAPMGPHQPVMVAEVLRCLQPSPGELAVDCTLGGGGHARALLERLQPGGCLIGLDIDSLELPRTLARIRAAGFGPATFVVHHQSFTSLRDVLHVHGCTRADLILADLGISTMQHDNPARGFNYKGVGPLDLRMDPAHGEPASRLLDRLSEDQLATLLTTNADEPHAPIIAHLLKQQPIATTHALERFVRLGLTAALPLLSKAAVKISVRRTLQALRIAVNDEFSALDLLLASLPECLAPGGRVAMLTFHSGEDRRVKKAFLAGYRAGVYSSVANKVIRSSMKETRANRRSTAAKLRWAVRAL